VKLTRRRFLAAGTVGLAAAGGAAFWVEPSRVTVTEHVLGNPDSVHPAFRILQLTDLHLREIGSHEEAVAKTVDRLRPHLIVITGDAIDQQDQLTTLATFLTMLPREVPVYATLGNWEHWAGIDLETLAATYASHGARLLVNQSVRLKHSGRSLLLTGLDDATAGHPKIRNALAGEMPSANHLLLAHSPVYRDELVFRASSGYAIAATEEPVFSLDQFSPEYVLSGHTHGGQVQLFGWAPLRPPGSGDYVEGWYRETLPYLYVSRGIGTSVIPVRFGAPPEVALFQWHLQDE